MVGSYEGRNMKLIMAIIILLSSACFGGYEYGYPAGGSTESDVAVQYIFDEPYGVIYDEVSNFMLYSYNKMDYQYDTSSYSSDMEYGVKIPYTGTYCFHRDGDQSTFDIGTSDATIELVYTNYQDLSDINMTVLDTTEESDAITQGYRLNFNAYTNGISMIVWAEDGTNSQGTWVVEDAFDEGDHKIRIVLDRSNVQALYYNGNWQTPWGFTPYMTAIANKQVKAHNVFVGSRPDYNYMARIVFNELRISLNDSNNSGGPNGG